MRHRAVWIIAASLAIWCSTNARVHAQANASARPAMNRLRFERVFDAPREKVFRAWTDPRAINKWFVYQTPVHWISDPVAHTALGGQYRFAVASDNDETQAFKFHGTYQEVQPPEKLVFTWDWEVLRDVGPGNTTVTVEFLNQSGKTKMVLTHEHLASAAARDPFKKGWARCFDRIAHLLSSAPLDAADRAQPFLRIQSPLIALEHISVIDGTGAEPHPDQTILIARGKIAAIGNAGSVPVPQDAHRIDLAGYSAIPGLVGCMTTCSTPPISSVPKEYWPTTCLSVTRVSISPAASPPSAQPALSNPTPISKSRKPSTLELCSAPK
jgi:uncharacterized protein YndB with AHSA1/START domain